MTAVDELPTLKSSRLKIVHLGLAKSDQVLDYYERNKAHLEPTEPKRKSNFYQDSFWRERIIDARQEFLGDVGFRFVLFDSESEDRVIGVMNFGQVIREAFQACYLGYSIDEKKQGKGLMTEALREGIRYMFEQKRIHRIMSNYMPDNLASGRVLEKLGFKIEGEAKEYLRINARWQDHVLTSLTNKHWILRIVPGEEPL